MSDNSEAVAEPVQPAPKPRRQPKRAAAEPEASQAQPQPSQADKARANQLLAKLTPRQKAYVHRRIAGDDRVEAARKAGYLDRSKSQLKNIEERKSVSEAFQMLVQLSVPGQKLLRVMQEGLEATAVEYAKDGGKITDERERPDYATRHRYANTLAQWAGYVVPEQQAAATGANHFALLHTVVNVNDKPAEQGPVVDVEEKAG